MNVAFCSLLLPEEKRIAERTKGSLSGISGHKFCKAIIHGLDENLSHPVKVFNIINALNYPKFPDLVFRSEQWRHADNSLDWHIGYINLFGIKYITQTYNLYRKLSVWVKEQKHEKCLLCVYNIFLPSMLAAYLLKKRYSEKVVLCLITGDLTGRFGAAQERETLKQKLIWQMGKIIEALAKKFDCFVFVTKEMAEVYGVAEKNFTVVECAYKEKPVHPNGKTSDMPTDGEKIVFYAGSLRQEYGIEHLLRAFSEIRDPSYRLWLAGGGSTVPAIQEYAAKDSRIEFLGFITPQEVEQRQKAATVLINPRTSEHEFVKYSFASKTMEGLASGKPYIAHRLPCDPPEYGNYIQYPDDETDEALRDKIMEICELPADERDRIGQRAKEFIIMEKNPAVMCKRIVDMWKEQFNGLECSV